MTEIGQVTLQEVSSRGRGRMVLARCWGRRLSLRSRMSTPATIVLSFGIPFALIPLLLITRSGDTMTDMVNRRVTTIVMLLITVIITTLNLYLLYDTVARLV